MSLLAPRFGAFAFSSTLVALSTAAAHASDKPATSYIYGGEIAKTCEFPTTVAGRDSCTGTLVHPKVILSAAHCGKHKEILLGEYKSKAARRVKTKWCETGPVDAQICVLQEAITDLPYAPIPQGCEVDILSESKSIVIAGYGYDENDPAGDGSIRDEKRWVETELFNVTGSELHLGKNGKTACNGDSGGPAFMQLEDGTWRTVGVTFAALGGGAHPNCKTARYKRSDKLLPWYLNQLKKHNETDIDLTPCFDDAGEWAPTKACGGYTKDVKGPFGAWDNNCGEGVPVVKYSATCGPPFAPNDEDEGSGDAGSGDEGSGDKDSGKDSGDSGDPGGSGDKSKDKEPEDKPKATLEFAKPSPDQSFAQGKDIAVKVELRGNADLEFVQLYVDDKAQAKVSTPPYTWTLSDLSVGEHELVAKGKLEDGAELKPRAVTISVRKSGGEEGSGKSPEDEGSEDSSGAGDEEDLPSGGKGCSVAADASTSLWLLGLGLVGWRRRRSR